MPLSDQEYLQINQSLFSLAHAYESRMAEDERRQSTGLLLSDRAVLMVLGQCAPLNSRQLSHLMDINPGTISVYVHRLVSKGLIQKMQDEDDRRNWWLSLTEAGQTAYRETIVGTVIYTRDFLSALDEAEQRTLHLLLLKASHSLGFGWQ
ncbi:MAG: MarR family transcriptional regulator [Chloroflexota bacterium]|nr:MarR family transcriptional regulator [Chloroflexota bacterium]